ncbi:hypothetical protein Q3G72_019059 [Acer saccharum]|nr:hypothetical protein Q3G72_019059 [Acer saccharum]
MKLTWIFQGYPDKFLDSQLVRTIVVEWYNLVAMNDHGLCHDLARGDNNRGMTWRDQGLVTNVQTGATQEVSFTGAGPRSVHRKSLLEALANELPIDTIRFSSKVASIETQTQENSPITIIHLGDGTIIKAKDVMGNWLGLAAPVNSGRSAMRGLAVFPQGHGLNHEFR